MSILHSDFPLTQTHTHATTLRNVRQEERVMLKLGFTVATTIANNNYPSKFHKFNCFHRRSQGIDNDEPEDNESSKHARGKQHILPESRRSELVF